jgi:hypothetical protein
MRPQPTSTNFRSLCCACDVIIAEVFPVITCEAEATAEATNVVAFESVIEGAPWPNAARSDDAIRPTDRDELPSTTPAFMAMKAQARQTPGMREFFTALCRTGDGCCVWL